MQQEINYQKNLYKELKKKSDMKIEDLEEKLK